MTSARQQLSDAFKRSVADTATEADDLDRYGPPVCIIRTSQMNGIRFELRPISVEPPARHSVTFMYRRKDNAFHAAGVGAFKLGRWTNGRGKSLDGDLYWTAMVDERANG